MHNQAKRWRYAKVPLRPFDENAADLPTEHLTVSLIRAPGCGRDEVRALQWTDVNLEKRQLRVERNDWQGLITTTKGGRLRHIPMTNRPVEELRAHRHLRAARVLCRADASGLTVASPALAAALPQGSLKHRRSSDGAAAR
jgi:integrase